MVRKLQITLVLLTVGMFYVPTALAQKSTITVLDSLSRLPIEFAQIKTLEGYKSSTDSSGRVIINVAFSGLQITAPNFYTKVINVKNTPEIIVMLSPLVISSGDVVITHNKQKEKLRESPITVESMGKIAIKETPAADFYESLGHLRGVDITTASLGFKVVNTRGFNSTSPVRSLQLIDGVDNQSPGLNFSLGNFLGASELDVENTEIIVGASSAYYGPNAFNGVINMTSKSAWKDTGFSAQIKLGERELRQLMMRYAKVWSNQKQMPKFALKANLYYMHALDWIADTKAATQDSKASTLNPGGYDAVNRYGDEVFGTASNDQVSDDSRFNYPGLGAFYRDGYWEKDLVDYHCNNIKSNLFLGYKINAKNEIQYAFNFGSGQTMYQGDNRYRLDGVLFFQNRIEWVGKNGFLRLYSTKEDAGKTYDAVLTAFLLQDAAKGGNYWYGDYQNYWAAYIKNKVKALPGYSALGSPVQGNPKYNPNFFKDQEEFLNKHRDSLVAWHTLVRNIANKYTDYQGNPRLDPSFNRFAPGTNEFNQAKNAITADYNYNHNGKLIGSRFFDKSALYHITGERRFEYRTWKFTSGFSGRLYKPYSKGTIFLDTGNARISNVEGGLYAGTEKRFWDKKLKINATFRVDKNQNFNWLFSPAMSFIYSKTKKHTYRISFSSAIRNPTLADQYLHYNVGRAILLGNIHGVQNVYDPENFITYLNTQNMDTLKKVFVKAIQPEKARTLEVGYKGFLLKNKLAVDAGYYFSLYKDFLGYRVVIDADMDTLLNLPKSATAYRVATNSENIVSTQGFSAGLNYFFGKAFMLAGNYSWNVLNKYGEDDPLIPAFNTPKHKFNIGVGASNIGKRKWFGKKLNLTNWGFNTNFKWVQGFLFEGSPQFTGNINSYWMLDAQISKQFVKLNSTLKIGASNLSNNKIIQVYGGPTIGRLAYLSWTWEPDWKPASNF